MLVTGGLLVLVGAVLAALLARDLLAVRRDLTEARALVEAARDALVVGDPEAARSSLAASRTSIVAADRPTNRFLWRAAERVPLLGHSFRVVDATVGVADRAAQVGRDVVGAMAELLGPDGRLEIRTVDGRLDLAPIVAADAGLDRVATQPLADAVATLGATSPTWLPGPIRDLRRDVLSLGEDAVDTIGGAAALLDALPGFLGAEGPRRYFLAMQNPAELRGTGGLVGFFAEVTADGGRMQMSEPRSYGVLERPSLVALAPGATDVDPAFAARYDDANAAGFLANVNLDPDLPTVAPVLLDLYEARTGRALDGVIVADPVALATILSEIGPVEIDPTVADPSGTIANPIAAEALPEVTMVEAYEVFGGRTDEREDFLEAVATAAFDLIFDGRWEAVAVGQRMAEASQGRHLQVFSRDEEEQTAFARLGIAGHLWPTTDPGDVLALTASNVVGNKLDAHVAHRYDATVRLVGDRPGAARTLTHLDVTIANPVRQGQFGEYVAGGRPVSRDGRPQPAIEPNGTVRTWFTYWGPPGSALLDATIDGEVTPAAARPFLDRVAVDTTVEVAAASERTIGMTVSAPARVRRDGPDLIYDLVVRRQPKAIADQLVLTVISPDGWEPVAASIAGGGDGAGLGPSGDPGPAVTVRSVGDAIEVAGDVTTDVRLRIRYTRGLWPRFDEGMRDLVN